MLLWLAFIGDDSGPMIRKRALSSVLLATVCLLGATHTSSLVLFYPYTRDFTRRCPLELVMLPTTNKVKTTRLEPHISPTHFRQQKSSVGQTMYGA